MMKDRARQAWEIARLEMRRAFFSKRGLWVYLLALFPAVIFFGHALQMQFENARWRSHTLANPALLDGVSPGDTPAAVIARLGEPATDDEWQQPRFRQRRSADGTQTVDEEESKTTRRRMMYFDGRRKAFLEFENGRLDNKNFQTMRNFEQDRMIFATVFQYFYLRLAIFFGCLGIFMNLFRGEMLDKTLHFWFLVPARREVLLLGKYLAGLVASAVIFTAGAMLCYAVMLWPHDGSEVQAYWQGPGLAHLVWYCVSAVLGCVGYGSVFLAAGLLLRNPIIPAAVLLLWESINGFLPDMLQKLSVLYYLQSLCPVPVPVASDAPALVRMLLSPAAPASRLGAIVGLLALTALVLWAASRAVRRIEINYGTE